MPLTISSSQVMTEVMIGNQGEWYAHAAPAAIGEFRRLLIW